MASILKFPISVNNALNFIERYNGDESPVEDFLYVGIGKETAWADDNNPPTPSDTIDEMRSFWDSLIGVQKVDITDIVAAKQRIDWSSGNEYFLLNESSTAAYAGDFYILNSQNQVFKVYDKDTGGPVTSNEPVFDPDVSTDPIIDTGDGYKWEFLYDIPTDDVSEINTDDWMIVNWDHNETQWQRDYGDPDAVRTLGARYCIIKIQLTDDKLPVDVEYRQIGILSNPLANTSGEPLFTDPVGLLATYNSPAEDDIVKYSGDLIYLENRTPIIRSSGQSETVKVLLKF